MDSLDIIGSISSDLATAMTAQERYQRLLVSLRRAIPYDAAALMKREGDALRIVVSHGLSADAAARSFPIDAHPRLEAIFRSRAPLIFPADSPLPDPFDGMMSDDPHVLAGIHSCMGCPLFAHGSLIGVLTADALRPGVFDVIEPRFLETVAALAAAEMRATDLIDALERQADRQGLIVRDLMKDARRHQGHTLVGESPAMRQLQRDMETVAWTDFSVLVTGETGTGKELVVHGIHGSSNRREQPLLYVNCAALPESLADSELFGHVKGAFTGAVADRPGKFEMADGGTLFLDEIGELPLSIQPKLLRALQQGEIQRVGADRPAKADVRVLAATNRDLAREVEAKRFRADLYHRLAIYPIHVPPLRERRSDIPLLAGHFCDRIGRGVGVGRARMEPEFLEALERYDWPGNVRELENVVSRALLKAMRGPRAAGPVALTRAHLGAEFHVPATRADVADAAVADALPPSRPLRESVDEFQRRLIREALARHAGNWAAAGRELGLQRANLHHLAKRLGLKS